MILSVGLSQIGYNGQTVVLSGASWKNYVNGIYTINSFGNGWSSFNPVSSFNSLLTLEEGKHYLIDVITSFNLVGASDSHGLGLPDGLVILDGPLIMM